MQFPCAECGKIFKRSNQLTKHRLGVHDVAKPNATVYPCTRCDRKFTDKRQLKEHTYSHEGIKPHQCPECDHRTVTFVNLKTHLKWKHKRLVSRKFRDGGGKVA
jgi:DNA-directed RNA polymerase subunit RPC12/RpoP